MVEAMAGVVLMALAFFAGLAVGSFGAARKWVERHGCYECREKLRYPDE